MSLPALDEEKQAVPDDDLDDILGASTGEFDVMSEAYEGSVQADNDLDELLGESTGEFRLDQSGYDSYDGGSPAVQRKEKSSKDLLAAHLAYLSRRTNSPALDDVRARIRELTIQKQKLYRALKR
jgi:hypothetical protein